MERIKEEELLQVAGGGIGKGILVAIGAIGIFLIGVVDGFLRPLKCNV